MSLKSSLGLDWFDLLIQVGITGMFMVVADSATQGQGSDALIAMVVASSLGLLAWRRARALRRGDLTPSGSYPADRIAELEHRVGELEARESRVLELEERLDFAERLLAQQRDPSRLGAGEQR
jgi:hypothetical protein